MSKTLTGVVASDVRDKTITVSIASRETHPIYKKQFTFTHRYTAHDENNTASKGDLVVIAESRPFSKTKTWKLVEIVEKARDEVKLKDASAEILPQKTDAEPPKSSPAAPSVKKKEVKS
jgi:small subunit ribosomal protein S17